MDSLETLNVHLDALDRLVTEDCRAILGFERQALINQRGTKVEAAVKESEVKEDEKRVINIIFIEKPLLSS